MMDTGEVIYLYVGKNIDPAVLQATLGPSVYTALPELMVCQTTDLSDEFFKIVTFKNSTVSLIAVRITRAGDTRV